MCISSVLLLVKVEFNAGYILFFFFFWLQSNRLLLFFITLRYFGRGLFVPFYFQDRTAEEWTGNRGERGGMTCSKGPQVESNPGPLLRGHSLCIWGACSTEWAPCFHLFKHLQASLGNVPFDSCAAETNRLHIFVECHPRAVQHINAAKKSIQQLHLIRLFACIWPCIECIIYKMTGWADGVYNLGNCCYLCPV